MPVMAQTYCWLSGLEYVNTFRKYVVIQQFMAFPP